MMSLCLFLVTKLACASKHLGVVFSIIKIFKEYSEKMFIHMVVILFLSFLMDTPQDLLDASHYAKFFS